MKKYFLLTAAAVALVLASSCGKEVEDKPTPKPDIAGKTNRQIFMMQNWHFKYWSDSAENDTRWEDQMDACMKDDVFSFFSTSKYKVIENSVKCDPNDYDVPWSMPSDNATTGISLHGFNDWQLIFKSNEKLILWRIQNGSEQHFQKLILTRD